MKHPTSEPPRRGDSRRKFIRKAATLAAVTSQPLFTGGAWAQGRKVAIFVHSDASDASVRQPPVRWAVAELRGALEGRGLNAEVHHNLDRIHDEGERIVVAPGSSLLAQQVTDRAGGRVPAVAPDRRRGRGPPRARAGLQHLGNCRSGPMFGRPRG